MDGRARDALKVEGPDGAPGHEARLGRGEGVHGFVRRALRAAVMR